jgi:hypothetical protein
MYYGNFDDGNPDEIPALERETIMKDAKDFLENQFGEMAEKLRVKMLEDIEAFLFERLITIKWKYFDAVKNFLLGKNETDEELKTWLSDVGYTAESFRHKIYTENKEEIDKAIASNAVYVLVQGMFATYWGHWHWPDIQKNLPQAVIMKNFARVVIDAHRKDLGDYISGLLDNEIQEKRKTLNDLRKTINDVLGEDAQ